MNEIERRRGGPPAQGGAPVYGLGLIGAAVWFWQQADDAAGRARGVLKAFAWPAFLVYAAFRALESRG